MGAIIEASVDIVYDIMVLKLVIDTDVLVAAVESPSGASRQLLVDVLDGLAEMLLSTALMLEYEAVLTRPERLARSRLDAGEILELLDELAGLCRPVEFDFRWRPVAADVDDDLVLETAINGGADLIASFNVKDQVVGAGRFGIVVERPSLVIRRILR